MFPLLDVDAILRSIAFLQDLADEYDGQVRRFLIGGVGNWAFSAEPTENGAILTVMVPPIDLPKLKALGFIGVMTRGVHHQEHHLNMARGHHPH